MSEESNDRSFRLDLAFAHLLLRLWVAERLIMAGVDKFRKGATADGATFNMENYKAKSAQIADLMASNSFLPKWMCEQYAMGIGFALLGVGAWVLIGLFTEFSLLAAGLVFLSLGFGLAALPDDTEVVYIGVSILITATALMTAKAKQISLDGLLFRRKAD
ncbi:DoxX-like protein [Roseimicrobium gellanilyticum]|uniref:DoxX-like protein n=1 Tax=Roseimicrobium gellanilyticum TaxID=748857 RepID=A0A366H5U9_9BACT|nr:DoxX family membrane protein [Roseimicrobium gellanilyticum]RBP36593.1 DoxX-like protein [Roseimicrobium gellanilyticum]